MKILVVQYGSRLPEDVIVKNLRKAEGPREVPLPGKASIRIHSVRGRQVILDSDLALVYGVSTRAFNQAIKRNPGRFPEDFAFVPDWGESRNMMSQIVTSKGRGGRRKLPRVLTEHGAIMAGNWRASMNCPRVDS